MDTTSRPPRTATPRADRALCRASLVQTQGLRATPAHPRGPPVRGVLKTIWHSDFVLSASFPFRECKGLISFPEGAHLVWDASHSSSIQSFEHDVSFLYPFQNLSILTQNIHPDLPIRSRHIHYKHSTRIHS